MVTQGLALSEEGRPCRELVGSDVAAPGGLDASSSTGPRRFADVGTGFAADSRPRGFVSHTRGTAPTSPPKSAPVLADEMRMAGQPAKSRRYGHRDPAVADVLAAAHATGIIKAEVQTGHDCIERWPGPRLGGVGAAARGPMRRSGVGRSRTETPEDAPPEAALSVTTASRSVQPSRRRSVVRASGIVPWTTRSVGPMRPASHRAPEDRVGRGHCAPRWAAEPDQRPNGREFARAMRQWEPSRPMERTVRGGASILRGRHPPAKYDDSRRTDVER